MRTLIGITLVAFMAGACASSTQTSQNATAPQAPAPAAHASLSPPDTAMAVRHLERHVQFPTDRAGVLAACADTEEFSASEKAWFETNLPEGSYTSAAEVIQALGLSH